MPGPCLSDGSQSAVRRPAVPAVPGTCKFSDPTLPHLQIRNSGGGAQQCALQQGLQELLRLPSPSLRTTGLGVISAQPGTSPEAGCSNDLKDSDPRGSGIASPRCSAVGEQPPSARSLRSFAGSAGPGAAGSGLADWNDGRETPL